MKKTLLFVLIVLLALLATGAFASYAEQEQVAPTANGDTLEIDNFVEQLCALNADGNKLEIINFLVDSFSQALGETDDTSASNVQVQAFPHGTDTYSNVVARLVKADTAKQIIIGAHYDSIRGEGAADNAVGVAALYLTMQTLAANKSSLPFNITFVAFDGEELGLLGSNFFVNGGELGKGGMSAEEIANTLVMFNIDSIAMGDNLYLLCENKRTKLADAILSNSTDIKEKPYARGTYGSDMDSFGYGYYEYVQGSDHTPFRLSGIPIAFLFSGTYSVLPWGFSESSNPSSQVINSSADTYENLVKSGVDYVARAQTVSSAISATILADDFATVAENARSQLVNLNFWYNRLWPSIAVAAILVILAVVTFFYYRKLQKKAILGTADIKTQKVFDKPDASEIFTFGGGSTKSDHATKTNDASKSDVDDIFTFRK